MNAGTGVLSLALLGLAASARAAAPLEPWRLASVSPPAGARAPMDGVFLDQEGRAVTLGGLSDGRPLVLVPVQHACRNLCSLTLEGLRSTIAGQPLRPGRDFALVAFGIDPRETPQLARQSALRLGGAGQGGASALVGSASQVAAVTSALGYRYSWVPVTRQYAHMSAIAVLAPDGRLVTWLQGLGASPAALQAALVKARTAAPFDPGGGIRLLCFHFDPATGRYTLEVMTALRWLAAVSALAIAAGVAFAVGRDRRRRAP